MNVAISLSLLSFGYAVLVLLLCGGKRSAHAVAASGIAAAHAPDSNQCVDITIERCKGLPYMQTTFPNLADNEDQADANQAMNTYDGFVQLGCSSQLQFFLCSVYVPMCSPNSEEPHGRPYRIGPCRPLCEKVRKRCEPELSKFGLPWPEKLDCHRFPLKNSENSMCMKGPGEEDEEQLTDSLSPNLSPLQPRLIRPSTSTCPNNNYVLVNRSNFRSCALRCGEGINGWFSNDQRLLVHIIVSTLACLCLLFAVLTVCMLRCSPFAFNYPEYPLLWINVCYGLAAVPYMVRLLAGRETISCVEYKHWWIMVVPGLQQVWCWLVAIFLYFCLLAAKLWWLMLCWTYLLSVGMRWSSAWLRARQFTLHALVWFLSGIMVVAALVKQAVDSDELTAMCFVGQQKGSELSLLALLIVPEIIIVALGAIAYLFSLLAAIRYSTRTTKRPSSSNDDTAHSSVGVLVVAGIYLLIGLSQICYYFWEYSQRPTWSDTRKPLVQVFLLKNCAILGYGVVVGMYVVMLQLSAIRCNGNLSSTHNKTPLLKDYPPQPMPLPPPTASIYQHQFV